MPGTREREILLLLAVRTKICPGHLDVMDINGRETWETVLSTVYLKLIHSTEELHTLYYCDYGLCVKMQKIVEDIVSAPPAQTD